MNKQFTQYASAPASGDMNSDPRPFSLDITRISMMRVFVFHRCATFEDRWPPPCEDITITSLQPAVVCGMGNYPANFGLSTAIASRFIGRHAQVDDVT